MTSHVKDSMEIKEVNIFSPKSSLPEYVQADRMTKNRV